MQSKLSASQLGSRSSLSKFAQDWVGGCKLKQTNHMFVKRKRESKSCSFSLEGNFGSTI